MEVPLPSDTLMARYDVPGPRYTSYPTAPTWRRDFTAEEHRQQLDRAAQTAGPLSLYVHLPFCKSLCLYCGCNIVISKEASAADRYLDHLVVEIDRVAARLKARRTVSQLHLGGGTPTFLSSAQLTRLHRAIEAHFAFTRDAELAVEIHPAITSTEQLCTLRGLGFNRLSMGLQDFDPLVQEATHRIQTPEQTATLLAQARALGFFGINFDLIYGLPHQTPERWARTLERVLQMRPDRLAAYSFAFMPDVLKHQKRLPAEALPSQKVKLGLFREVFRAFVEAGYRPIGMDHFALPDDELTLAQARGTLGRNFQGYTVQSARDVVAFGASAISDVAGAYVQNVRNLAQYYQRIERGELATERGLKLGPEDLARGEIIRSLMCHFQADLGADEAAFAPELERLAPMESDGLLVRERGRVTLTPLGRLFVRNVAMAFDAYLHQDAPRRFSRTV